MKQDSMLKVSPRWLIAILAFAVILMPESVAQDNIVSIGDAVLDPGSSITLPVTITSATGVAGVQIKLSYSPTVVNVTGAVDGDFMPQPGFESSNAANGWVSITAYKFGETGLTGNVIIAYVTLEAKGNSGESPLNIEIISLTDGAGTEIPRVIHNGNLKIRAQTSTQTPVQGSGGGGVSGEDLSNIEVKEKYDRQIFKDRATAYTFTNRSNPVLFINITGNTSAGEINVAVEVLRNTSSLVKSPAPGILYKYLNIWVGTSGFATPGNIKHAEITFNVPRSWIEANSIESINMMRYESSWQSLPTQKIREDEEYLYYEVSTSSFSPFAVTGTAGSQKISQPAGTGSRQEEPVKSNETEISKPGNPGSSRSFLFIILLMGIIVISYISYRLRKAGKGLPKNNLEKFIM